MSCIENEPPAIRTHDINASFYLLRESAATRLMSSIEASGDDGKIPRFIRHRTPLRLANLEPSARDPPATEGDDED